MRHLPLLLLVIVCGCKSVQRDPTLTILPAHDRDVWMEIFGAEAPICLPAL